MRQLSNLPTNNKTLFLRNLEAVLICSELLYADERKAFRSVIAPLILNLLEKYEYSIEDDSHQGLVNQYISDSISMRTFSEIN
jgi:hypothetical protein